MKNWDLAIEGISVGAAAAAVGVSAVAMIKFGASQEALLSFMGALIGAATTVAGAAWLADRTSRRERRAESDAIGQEMTNALDAAKRAQTRFSPDSWTKEWKQAIHDAASVIAEARAVLSEATNRAKTIDFRQRVKITKAVQAMMQFEGFYGDVFSEFELDPQDNVTGQAPSAISYHA